MRKVNVNEVLPLWWCSDTGRRGLNELRL